MPNPMNLNLTVAGTTPGGTYTGSFYGPLIDVNWADISNHDHTTGKGVPITAAALNIDGDINWNSHAVTNMSALGVTSITSNVSFTTHNLTSIGNASGNHFFSAFQYDVYNYGAVGDGTTDDRAAFFNACAAIVASTAGVGVLRLDAGKFRIGSNLTIPVGVTLQFNGGTMLADNGIQVAIKEPIMAPQNQRIFFYTNGYSVVPFQFWSPSGAPDPVYMTWFGLVSDIHAAGTQNPYAFKAAIDSCAYPAANADGSITQGGGRIVVPTGVYNFPTGWIVQGTQYAGITIEGQTWGPLANSGVTIYFTQTDGSPCWFMGGTLSGIGALALSRIVVRNIQFVQGPQAGPFCLGPDNTVPVMGQPNSGVGYGLSACLFDQLTFNCENGSVIGMKQRVQDTEFRNCSWFAQAGRSKPVIYVDGGNDQFHTAGTTSFGQSEKVNYTGVTLFSQVFNVSTPESAPFYFAEAWGTGIGVSNFSFEIVRTEQIHAGAFEISGCQFFTFNNLCFEDPGATALIQPNLLVTYNSNDSTTHFGANVVVVGGFGQPNDSSSIPELKFVGNPSGGPSGGVYGIVLIGCLFGHFEATNCVPVFVSSFATKASGSLDALWIGNNDFGLTGIGGISSGPTAAINLCGTATVLSSTTSIAVTFAQSETDANYLVYLTPRVSGTASTVAASYAAYATSLSTSGFSIVVLGAPNHDLPYDWAILRND